MEVRCDVWATGCYVLYVVRGGLRGEGWVAV